jgi:two-component system LytT family sensor kinase
MRHAGGDVATMAVLVAVYLLLDARQRAHAREVATTALEARAAAADLEVLRLQLQPHFLFNALNTVSTLVLRGDNARADDAIGRISRYLRSALAQRTDAMVTVGQEIDDVKQYFAIERLRFGDTVCLDVSAESDALRARIPALIVQPLVENALRHGLSPAGHSSRIALAAAVRGDGVELRVRNASNGAAAEHPGSENGSGFGLRYVRERLKHFYGDGASVTLDRGSAETVVTVRVPLVPPHAEAAS